MAPKPIQIIDVAPATLEDHEAVFYSRPKVRIAQIRDSHHHLARLLASGMTNREAADQSGYSLGRVVQLKSDPAFIDLMENYRKIDLESWRESRDHFHDTLARLRTKAARQIEEQLDEADETNDRISLDRLIKVMDTGADRTGYQKRTTNLNVNVDFAAKLEAAIARSRRPKMLEAE